MITIRLLGSIREKVGKSIIKLAESDIKVRELLGRINVDGSSLLRLIVDDKGNVRKGIHIIVNERDIFQLKGLETKVKNGDNILIGPLPIGGGMIDISGKPFSYRIAQAEGYIILKPGTIDKIRQGDIEKGDVYEAVKLSVLNAVKNTPNFLFYCHPIKITDVKVDMDVLDDRVKVRVTVKALEQTGVEMEALTGVSVGLLTIWDMVKKYEKDKTGNYPTTIIKNIRVIKKEKKEYE